jgi:hypothetical protein
MIIAAGFGPGAQPWAQLAEEEAALIMQRDADNDEVTQLEAFSNLNPPPYIQLLIDNSLNAFRASRDRAILRLQVSISSTLDTRIFL